MKKFYIFTLLCLGLIAINVQGQKDEKSVSKKKKAEELKLDTRVDNMGYWNHMIKLGVTKGNPPIPFKPGEYKGSQIVATGLKAQDSPDVPVSSSTNIAETENSIFVDPTDNQFVLNSNNSTDWSGGSVGTLYGANYFLGTNGGTTWGGSASGAGGTNSGDPATAISLDGSRMYVGYIDDAYGMGVSYSTDGGSSFTPVTVAGGGYLLDKNHMGIDIGPSSPYEGNLYDVWTNLISGNVNETEIEYSRSTDGGLTWSNSIVLSADVNAGSHNQGVNVQSGPNGEVYVVWTVYDSWPSDETALGLAKSTNGGASFSPSTRIISNIRGIRNTGVPQDMRVNSFPSMAVDISGGPNNGNVYIVWTNIGTPGVNTGTAGVYIIKSTDGGSNWSTPVKMNSGSGTAYFPWITCDPVTGTLAIVFYDNRNTAAADCEAWAAYSTDAGSTWIDFKVSDVSFTPGPIAGLATGYFGDYLGITSRGGMVYPCWTDNRDGGRPMTYVSPFEIGLNAGFTADNTSVCTANSVTFTDQSSGSPTTWSWSFPGGSPSSHNGQNPPAITYNTPGTYNVSLTVGDGTDTDTENKTGYITVQYVIADFTAAPTSVVVGNTVTFTDNSSCGPTSWSWTFPGGIPSSFSGQNPPPIQYDVEGSYDVTLTVTNASGSDAKTIPGYITVVPPEFNMQNGTVTTCEGNFYDSGGPSGEYSSNENLTQTFYPSTPGAMIRFTFNSFETESGYDYLRIYNGENTSAPLIGTYDGTTSPGTVTASGLTGALTFNFTSDGSVTRPGWEASISCYSAVLPPTADFSASTTSPAIGTDVLFTDISTDVPTSWEWSFSPSTVVYVNGTSSTFQNPEVQFTELGFYTVSLTATNAYGSDVEIKTDYINVITCTYCTTSYSNTADEWISNVDFNTISNPSGSTSYSDFTAISTDVTPGSTYNISVGITVASTYNEHCIVFIDWNQNCDFTDIGESFDLGEVNGSGILSSDILIPAGAQSGVTRMRVSMRWDVDPDGCDVTTYGEAEDYSINVLGGSSHVTLDLKAYLEGPYNGINMNSDIVQLLPLSQPFNTSPWNYSGTESVVSIPNSNVVEWVLIDVRDAATAATASSVTSVAKQAAFILNDGTIVDLDGSSNLQFDVSISQNLFVVVWQRNHLGIISNDPITPSAGLYTYDFTTGINQVFGGIDGHKEISIGIWGMIGGDGNHDGTVNINDKSPLWENQAGVQGYNYSDHNLDGEIDNQDKDDILVPNLDKSSQVPN